MAQAGGLSFRAQTQRLLSEELLGTAIHSQFGFGFGFVFAAGAAKRTVSG